MNLLKKYDKLTHFIVGGLIFFLPIELTFSIMVIKEIFDCYKKNPTGFDIPDILSGMGGYLLVNEILKMII